MNTDVEWLNIGWLCTYPELFGGGGGGVKEPGMVAAGKRNLIVVVLSFNGVPGFGQIEVDSFLHRVWVARVEGSVKVEK